MFYAVISVLSHLAEEERLAASRCLVTVNVLWLFLTVPWVSY